MCSIPLNVGVVRLWGSQSSFSVQQRREDLVKHRLSKARSVAGETRAMGMSAPGHDMKSLKSEGTKIIETEEVHVQATSLLYDRVSLGILTSGRG